MKGFEILASEQRIHTTIQKYRTANGQVCFFLISYGINCEFSRKKGLLEKKCSTNTVFKNSEV